MHSDAEDVQQYFRRVVLADIVHVCTFVLRELDQGCCTTIDLRYMLCDFVLRGLIGCDYAQTPLRRFYRAMH